MGEAVRSRRQALEAAPEEPRERRGDPDAVALAKELGILAEEDDGELRWRRDALPAGFDPERLAQELSSLEPATREIASARAERRDVVVRRARLKQELEQQGVEPLEGGSYRDLLLREHELFLSEAERRLEVCEAKLRIKQMLEGVPLREALETPHAAGRLERYQSLARSELEVEIATARDAMHSARERLERLRAYLGEAPAAA